VKAYVWSIALYGSEAWIIGDAERRRLEAFKAWYRRRMMRMSWMERVTNEKVFARHGDKTNLWTNLFKRRDELIGYLLQHE
jgi:hypothetical protein